MATTQLGSSHAKWPTVEEQLQHAGVVHGSELEKLIRANQEPHLLRPEEHENDGIDIPLWLRVHWRKQHPSRPHAPAGAVSDYPEALENLHEWMKKNQSLQRS